MSVDAGVDYDPMDADAVNIEQQLMGEYTIDENPPPLPPRTHSLYPTGVPAANENLNELIFVNNANEQLKDALNNFISNETISQRPLPPLPPLPKHKQQKLDRVHENINNEYFDDDDDDGDDFMDDIEEENDDDDDDDDSEFAENGMINSLDDSDSSDYGIEAQTNVNEPNVKVVDNETINTEQGNIYNGSEVHNENSTVTNQRELRRRKRAQRKDNLEQIVKDIKRKQIESETNASTSISKRISNIKNTSRGSLFACLTAGLFVGALCVYAYTKMG